jgi:hypothetical protein
MTAVTFSSSDSAGPQRLPGEAGTEPIDPRVDFRDTLARYDPKRLAVLVRRRGLEIDNHRPAAIAAQLTDQLDSPSVIAEVLAGLGAGERQALSLFGLTETTVWPVTDLRHALVSLGVEPDPAILELLDRGLLALDGTLYQLPIDSFEPGIGDRSFGILLAHPSVLRYVRVTRPAGKLPACQAAVVQIRESDGLEAVLRLGALWQRVGVEPLRQTLQGALYKRDRERVEQDSVLADDVSDAVVPLSGPPRFWLALARRVGLIRVDASEERLVAAPTTFWTENAVHLPQMIATAWTGLQLGWDRELETGDSAGAVSPLAFLRPAVLLWLATLEDDDWTTLDDLAEQLRALNPDWDRLTIRGEAEPDRTTNRRVPARGKADPQKHRSSRDKRLLGSMLLGEGYALGMVRAGEEQGTRRLAIQLTRLGRYVLTLGPPPPPLPSFEHFLFVQPNLEIVAYRQGVTPQLAGVLSCFAWWTKIGAALELKLTQESITLGLEAGQTPKLMLEVLRGHSQRPLPTVVPDVIARWASRRERITFYMSATLIEFASAQERDQSLASWAEHQAGVFVPVADRFLLVEDAQKIPTDKVRTRGSRDYRHPPERCVSTEPDGITLALDATRSDLLIDAELSRVAEELSRAGVEPGATDAETLTRKYMVTPSSIRRAIGLGITPAQIVEWFQRRTGNPPSPAIYLLLSAVHAAPSTLGTRRLLVLTAPTSELADGLLQHPATRELLGERLGPYTLVVPEDSLESLKRVLGELGLRLNEN